MAKKQKYDKSNTQFETCKICNQVIKSMTIILKGKKKKTKVCGCE